MDEPAPLHRACNTPASSTNRYVRPTQRSSVTVSILTSTVFGAAVAAAHSPLECGTELENPAHAAVEVVGRVMEPVELEATGAHLSQLQLPVDFEIGVLADRLIDPRILAVADDDLVYVTPRSVGDVFVLADGRPSARVGTHRDGN